MAGKSAPPGFWRLVRSQHGVVARRQLLALGFTASALDHRIAAGRLHAVYAGVYAVGRRELTAHGRWMAAVLACGEGACLSHASAAALWRIRAEDPRLIHVSVPRPRAPRRRGIRVHRRRAMPAAARKCGIPVTGPAQTVIDVARDLTEAQLWSAIDEADKLDLASPQDLRVAAEGGPGAGAARVRRLLDRETVVLTRSALERRFVPLAKRAGLPTPDTQAEVNGVRVDFYFSELGLVVETDGGRFHRTPAQQTRDRRRDQAHLAAGLTPLRFTHAQIRFEPDDVVETLVRIARRQRPPAGLDDT